MIARKPILGQPAGSIQNDFEFRMIYKGPDLLKIYVPSLIYQNFTIVYILIIFSKIDFIKLYLIDCWLLFLTYFEEDSHKNHVNI